MGAFKDDAESRVDIDASAWDAHRRALMRFTFHGVGALVALRSGGRGGPDALG